MAAEVRPEAPWRLSRDSGRSCGFLRRHSTQMSASGRGTRRLRSSREPSSRRGERAAVARHHVEQRRPEREDVRLRPDFLLLTLILLLRARVAVSEPARTAPTGSFSERQAEIEYLRVPIAPRLPAP